MFTHNWCREDTNRLIKDKPNRLIIANTEEFRILKKYYYQIGLDELIDSLNGNVDIINGCFPYTQIKPLQYYKENLRNHFFPEFWGFASKLTVVDGLNNTICEVPKHLFVSLNNRQHYHRCVLMDMLHKYKLLKSNPVSWNTDEKESREIYDFKYWNPKKVLLDKDYKGHLTSHSVLPIQFYESLFSLASESTMDVMFITEKTWVPMLLGKPVVIQGPQHIHKKLSSWGIEPYDEIIDYSFDDEEDVVKRTEMIAIEFRKLQKTSPEKLREVIKKKIEANKQASWRVVSDIARIPDIFIEMCELSDTTNHRSALVMNRRILEDLRKS